MSTYQSKRAARLKQGEARQHLRGKKYFALLMAMRTGKTKVAIDDWAEMVHDGIVDDMLLIAPAGVYEVWADEIPKDVPPLILGQTWVFVWRSGQVKPSEYMNFMSWRGPRVLLMNVEALSAVKAAREMCLTFLGQRPGRNVGTVDESVIIKNEDAKRTLFVVEQLAPLCEYRRILTGLLTPRAPTDIYYQFAFLDKSILGFPDYNHFQARHTEKKLIKVGKRYIRKVVGFKDVDTIWGKIEPHCFKCRLEDCYDLPPSQYVYRDVTLTPEQKKLYEEMKKFATAELEDGTHVTGFMVVTQMMRLHTIVCGHVTNEFGATRSISENRTSSLIQMLEDYDGKAVIWCSYDEDLQRVHAALERHFGCRVARFWGGNRNTREEEEKHFQQSAEWPYIIATPDAGKYGRMWAMADLVCYYSSKNNLDHRMQSEERVKAVDKKQSILYVDFRARGTVEEKIIQALKDKQQLASLITGDNWREWLV